MSVFYIEGKDMPDRTDLNTGVELLGVQALIAKLGSDRSAMQAFVGRVNSAAALAAFAEENKIVLTAEEAEEAFSAMQSAASGQQAVDDAQLTDVTGGALAIKSFWSQYNRMNNQNGG
ncbi:hypothetical protein [Aquabacter sediminis]|uniref:hypothetical protein n=1 Tax=Aquabacter sediminis TaxID=3029197 RepID=UPI00237E86DC|nr:hypothetical protein [Aquabacter sp. P-9]MDE1568998.1 hypothetical protein [Aquabacter sp. P-9]